MAETGIKAGKGQRESSKKSLMQASVSSGSVMKGYRVCDGIELFPGGAALMVDENALVVADLHLGCEAALEYEGMSLPRVQTKAIESYLVDLVSSIAPRKLIVAGDLKHNFSRNLTQEWKDVTRFVRTLTDMVRVQVVKGNHDNYLGSILRECGIPLRRELTASGIRVLHGHSGKLDGQLTIMGHVHPSIRLRDNIGASFKDQCFLIDEGRRVLVLPALSIVAYGTDVVSQHSSDTISPLLSDAGMRDFIPIAFSGRKPLRFPTVGELRNASLPMS